MPYKRIAAAATALLAVTYLKLCMPVFASDVIPAFRAVMDEQQIAVHIPEAWMTGLGLD